MFAANKSLEHVIKLGFPLRDWNNGIATHFNVEPIIESSASSSTSAVDIRLEICMLSVIVDFTGFDKAFNVDEL